MVRYQHTVTKLSMSEKQYVFFKLVKPDSGSAEKVVSLLFRLNHIVKIFEAFR